MWLCADEHASISTEFDADQEYMYHVGSMKIPFANVLIKWIYKKSNIEAILVRHLWFEELRDRLCEWCKYECKTSEKH